MTHLMQLWIITLPGIGGSRTTHSVKLYKYTADHPADATSPPASCAPGLSPSGSKSTTESVRSETKRDSAVTDLVAVAAS